MREAIQAIVGSGDGRRDRAARIFFLHLRDPIPGVIRVIRRGAVLEDSFSFPIQGIVGIGRHLVLAIGHRGHIPIVVVGVDLGVQ